jgi:membrane-associated phospholipid phosphatase
MQLVARAKFVAATALAATVLAVTPAGRAVAQRAASWPDPSRPGFWWVGGTLIAIAALSDAALERNSLEHRSTTLDELSQTGNALGTGRYLIPALGASYVAGWVARERRVTDAALHAAAAYALGNLVTSVGKPVIGRHRPDTTGSPWRFHLFARVGAWHSLPSAHTLHAFTLAGALAEEARRPWVTTAAYGLASLVAWSRTYEDEHWASDVAASAVIGAAIGHATVRRLHTRARAAERGYEITPSAGGVTVMVRW